MKILELKVPPLPLAVGIGVLMWAIDRWALPHSDRSVVRAGILVAVLGFAVAILAAALDGKSRP
jgi:hypothetical protein